MRKRIATLVASIGLAVLVAAPALGAPSNGSKAEVIPVTCNGVSQYVLVGGGSPAWGSNASGNLDGTMYLLKEIDVRAYLGLLTTEPTTAPVFGYAKTYGNKTGLGGTLHCTFVEVMTDGGVTFTGFGDAWVVQIR